MPITSKQLSGVYNLTELNALLSILNNALLNQQRPFGHRLTLIFRSPSEKSLVKLQFQPNQPHYTARLAHSREHLITNDIQALAGFIYNHTKPAEDKLTIYGTTFFTHSKTAHRAFIKSLNGCEQTIAWQLMHKTSSEKVNYKNRHGQSWLNLAARMGLIDTTKLLNKRMHFYNKPENFNTIVGASTATTINVGVLIALCVLAPEFIFLPIASTVLAGSELHSKTRRTNKAMLHDAKIHRRHVGLFSHDSRHHHHQHTHCSQPRYQP